MSGLPVGEAVGDCFVRLNCGRFPLNPTDSETHHIGLESRRTWAATFAILVATLFIHLRRKSSAGILQLCTTDDLERIRETSQCNGVSHVNLYETLILFFSIRRSQKFPQQRLDAYRQVEVFPKFVHL